LVCSSIHASKSFSFSGSNLVNSSPAASAPHGDAPAPCQPPALRLTFWVPHENGVGICLNRISPHSTSPKPDTSLVIPVLTLRIRLSSATALPHPDVPHVAHATSAPG